MGWFANRRRDKLLAQPFPDEWVAYLRANNGAYHLLGDDDRARLHALVQVFVAEATWEGCGGMVVDDEVKVTIAGSAARMALARGLDIFGSIGSIYVYPSAVVTRRADVNVYTSPTPVEDGYAIDGQAHPKGPIILAWDAVLDGAADPFDGRDVVIHELAHKLDFLDGAANGTPVLRGKRARAEWRAAFEPAFLAHRARAERGEPSLIRDYATLDPAEYFACASEVFFERPRELRAELPAVYACLSAFYGLGLSVN